MNTPKITNEEQIHLRNKAKAEMERLEELLSNEETMQVIDLFKNKFNVCETTYKVILAEHQTKKNKDTGNLKLNMNQVVPALNFAGYHFDKANLNELFGSKSADNQHQTAKKLRDGITHGMDPKCVREITERKDELWEYMDAFLDEIRNFDAVTV